MQACDKSSGGAVLRLDKTTSYIGHTCRHTDNTHILESAHRRLARRAKSHHVIIGLVASPRFVSLFGRRARHLHLTTDLPMISSCEKQEAAGALSRHLFGLTNIRFFSPT